MCSVLVIFLLCVTGCTIQKGTVIGLGEDLDLSENWLLVMRAVQGNGQHVLKSWMNANFSAECLESEGCLLEGEPWGNGDPRRRERLMNSNMTLRSRILMGWRDFNIHRVAIMMSHRLTNDKVWFTFDAKRQDITDWFHQYRMNGSSFADITNPNYQCYTYINGYHRDDSRSFAIHRKFQSVASTRYPYNTCIEDEGWMMVIEDGEHKCMYDKHAAYPQFIYIRGSKGGSFFEQGWKQADFFSVYVSFK